MKYKSTLRKAAELGIGLTAVSVLLVGCLGGGSGTAAVGAGAATTTATVTPFKGMFQSGTVTLIDANGNPVSLVSGGSINGTTGVATLTYPTNVAYPLTVRVNGTYLDETNGFSPASMVAGSYLSGLIPSAADAASGVPVTAITDIARAMLPASGISAASAVAAITGVASGVMGTGSYAQAMAKPVFDSTGHSSDVNTIKLAALAQVIAGGTGTDLIGKLHNMASQLLAGSAVNAVIPQGTFATALSNMNSASGVLPASAVAPTITPPNLSGMTLGNVISANLPSCPNGLLVGSNGLVCAPVTGGANQTACTAAGGMWDPVINICLNLPASGVGAVIPAASTCTAPNVAVPDVTKPASPQICVPGPLPKCFDALMFPVWDGSGLLCV